MTVVEVVVVAVVVEPVVVVVVEAVEVVVVEVVVETVVVETVEVVVVVVAEVVEEVVRLQVELSNGSHTIRTDHRVTVNCHQSAVTSNSRLFRNCKKLLETIFTRINTFTKKQFSEMTASSKISSFN